jgi:S-methylmethionine-dependent homocysteine/selenocysteine methylase
VARYRNALPQVADGVTMLTDGGLETALTFRDGIDLPYNAACELLRSEHGMRVLLDYYDENAAIAAEAGLPFSVDSPTWRANPDWTTRLGYSRDEFVEVNREGVRMAQEVRRRHESITTPVVIAGVVGPRSAGFQPGERQSAGQAADYHFRQVDVLAGTEADYINALTLNYSAEALGIARAAEAAGIPAVISFTVETNGLLASGESLGEAIEVVEEGTDAYPAYYALNCVHPSHLPQALTSGAPWTRRIRAYRANSTRRSHREITAANNLDEGTPHELVEQFRELRESLPQLTVVGGCCGSGSGVTLAIAAALVGRPIVG